MVPGGGGDDRWAWFAGEELQRRGRAVTPREFTGAAQHWTLKRVRQLARHRAHRCQTPHPVLDWWYDMNDP
jgi:hypothetical protein